MVALSDRILLTAEEYLDWEAAQAERHELWDGEVVAMTGTTRNHNRISGNFFKALDEALADRPCEVYIADIKVQVDPGQKYFYPDVVVTCDERDDDSRFVQFPCLIIEVLSPSTEAVDRGIKFSHYRKFTTLQEYVLIQTDFPMVEVFHRNAQGQWVLTEYGGEDCLQLESVAVEVKVADLYRQVKFETTTAE
jgi:Uma2 family endonuclease